MREPEAMPVYTGKCEDGTIMVIGNEGHWDGRSLTMGTSGVYHVLRLEHFSHRETVAMFPSYRHAQEAYEAAGEAVTLPEMLTIIELKEKRAWAMVEENQVVYILHFDCKFGKPQTNEQREMYGLGRRINGYKSHAQHYVGYSEAFQARMELHSNGNRSKKPALIQALDRAGIGWTVADVYPGERERERSLKDRNNTPRYCPICREEKQWAKPALAAAKS